MSQADAGISPRSYGFNRKVVHAGFVVDTVSVEQIFLEALDFSSTSTFPQVIHNH